MENSFLPKLRQAPVGRWCLSLIFPLITQIYPQINADHFCVNQHVFNLRNQLERIIIIKMIHYRRAAFYYLQNQYAYFCRPPFTY